MPLIDLKTDLKSLKYGKDRIGGGNSGQPYIKSNIPDNVSSLAGSEDFLLRGGANAVASSATDVLRMTKMFSDLKSPSGLLFTAKQNLLSRTSPRTQTSGLLNDGVYTPLSTIGQAGVNAFGGHLNKQGVNPFSTPPLYFDKVKTNPNDTLGSTETNRLFQIYNSIQTNSPTSTRDGYELNFGNNILSYNGGPGSDVGIGKTNIRFADQRTGTNNPLSVSNPTYFYTGSRLTNTSDLDEKRYFSTFEVPILLSSNRFSTQTVSQIGDTILSPFTINNELIDKVIPYSGSYQKGIQNSSTNRTGLFNGSLDYAKLTRSGSSQTYIDLTKNTYTGVGEVINNDFYQANSLNVYTQGNTFPEVGPLQRVNNTFTYTQEELINSNPASRTGTIQDFRKVIRDSLVDTTAGEASGQLTNAPDYTDKNIESRILIGDPGNRKTKSYASYTKGPVDRATGESVGPLDKINALPIYRSEAVDTNQDVNDLVKFRIAIIDNDDPTFKTFLHFRAYLDVISDNFSAEWGPTSYLGRGEKFYNYNGFDRKIDLGWTVAAQSKAELIPMYRKLNYLASTLAPDYSGEGYMRGNLVQLTIGGYLYEQPGIITSLNYTMETTSPWEIGINDSGNSDESVKELAHIIKVSGFSFIPIHNFVPQKQNNIFDDQGNLIDYGPERYIALSDGSNNNYDN